ncbi:MAG: hypothetical protein H6822_13765 [Planctomycetaceae bacterium]|nr:hypothetical protein [Planctomycetales bacterium]MCB9923244.1 hypothetical protein [Planctomycetaceae bacterium]
MVDDTNPVNPRRTAVLLVATCALLIRLAFIMTSADELRADPDAYRAIAENLRQNAIYGSTSSPTAFRPPLYPVLLAVLAVSGKVTPALVAGVHLLFGVITVLLTFVLGHHWRLGRWSYAAAGLVAVDPLLLNQSALVMTETLATLLATAGLLALASWDRQPSMLRTLMAGLIFGLACLCRPTFVPWLGLCIVATIVSRCSSWKLSALLAPTLNAVAFGLSAALVISPWVVRNMLVFGVPKLTTTHGGYTVLLGNNPGFYRYLRDAPRGTTWDSTELADVWEARRYVKSPDELLWKTPHEVSKQPIHRTEFEDDDFAYSLAERYIRDDPGMFAYSCIIRVNRLWQLAPYRTTGSESTARMLMRILIGCWYGALFLLAIVAMSSLRSQMFGRPFIWGLLLCVAFTCVHTLYWSNMRMRAPLMPYVCLLAASGMARISTYLRDRKP